MVDSQPPEDDRPAQETQLDSDSEDDLPTLSPSTLSALTSFFDEQEVARKTLLSLSIESHPQSSTTAAGTDITSHSDCQLEETESKSRITVETFKEAFKENWQLSQFWYSRDTAERLTRALASLCTVSERVAFVCCPTGYVAFKARGPKATNVFLLEHDIRFSIIAGADFIPYDIDAPLSFANAEDLKGSMDLVVVDPPFHSEESQKKVSSTIAHIIRPGGRLVVLTGLTLSRLIENIYPSPPLPKLRRRDFTIDHDGVGMLATPYGCWVGVGEEDLDDSGFGSILDDQGI